MGYEKVKIKLGMEGRTTRTSRWGTRAIVKAATRKRRRVEGKNAARELRDEESD